MTEGRKEYVEMLREAAKKQPGNVIDFKKAKGQVVEDYVRNCIARFKEIRASYLQDPHISKQEVAEVVADCDQMIAKWERKLREVWGK